MTHDNGPRRLGVVAIVSARSAYWYTTVTYATCYTLYAIFVISSTLLKSVFGQDYQRTSSSSSLSWDPDESHWAGGAETEPPAVCCSSPSFYPYTDKMSVLVRENGGRALSWGRVSVSNWSRELFQNTCRESISNSQSWNNSFIILIHILFTKLCKVTSCIIYKDLKNNLPKSQAQLTSGSKG